MCMCVPERNVCACACAWFMSANILSRSFQIFLYVRLCLVTKSGLCFPKIHLFCVRLMNWFAKAHSVPNLHRMGEFAAAYSIRIAQKICIN